MGDLDDRAKSNTSKQSKPKESWPGDITVIELALRLSQSLEKAGLLRCLDRFSGSICCLLPSVLSICDCRLKAAQCVGLVVVAL